MFCKFRKITRRLHSSENGSHNQDVWYKRNLEKIVGGSLISGVFYYLYYTYKKNSVINVRMLPPSPSNGIVMDVNKQIYLLDKFRECSKTNLKTKYMCLYGKLGAGKSLMVSELAKILVPRNQRSIIGIPKSSILVFLDCKSMDSLTDSLIEFYSRLQLSQNSNTSQKLKTLDLDTFGSFTIEDEKDLFDSMKLDLPKEDIINYLIKEITCTLECHQGWLFVLDNINSSNYEEIRDFFTKYILSDYFHNQKGSFLLVCDTDEPILPDIPFSYRLSGLSLETARELFLKYSDISTEALPLHDKDFNSILHLLHTQPLSVISFALMVKKRLIENPVQSIKDGIKKVEEEILSNVKDQIYKNNIMVSPDNFETLYTRCILEMAIEKFYDPDSVYLKHLIILSLLSMFSPVPETLSAKIMNNLNINANAANVDDLCIKPKDNFLFDPQFTMREAFFQIVKNRKRILEEASDYSYALSRISESTSCIRYNERIALKYKSCPYLNFTSAPDQDYFSLHPLVYTVLKRAYSDVHYKSFKGYSNGSSVSLWHYLFSKKSVKLSDLWERHHGFKTTKYFTPSEEDEKYQILDYVFSEILNCLSHKDPVRYANRHKLTYIRARHLNYFLNDFNLCREKMIDSEYHSQRDIKFIAQIYNSLSSAYNDVRIFKLSIQLCDQCLLFLNKTVHKQSIFTSQFIDLYLIKTQALLALKLTDQALACIMPLWTMVEPYNRLAYPIASLKLISYILQYYHITKERIVQNCSLLDLSIHALDKLNIACLDASLPIEQLAEDMMEIYLFYGLELILNNFIHYASYLIQQAEIFNTEIFKNDIKSKHSPFDGKIMKLKIFLESVKGNIQMSDILIKQYLASES